MSFSLNSFRAVRDDACERCHLPFRDTERKFSCLAGYLPIWNNFLESGHFLSQLPSSLSEEVAAIGHNNRQ